jgi:hypothetical protein
MMEKVCLKGMAAPLIGARCVPLCRLVGEGIGQFWASAGPFDIFSEWLARSKPADGALPVNWAHVDDSGRSLPVDILCAGPLNQRRW